MISRAVHACLQCIPRVYVHTPGWDKQQACGEVFGMGLVEGADADAGAGLVYFITFPGYDSYREGLSDPVQGKWSLHYLQWVR